MLRLLLLVELRTHLCALGSETCNGAERDSSLVLEGAESHSFSLSLSLSLSLSPITERHWQMEQLYKARESARISIVVRLLLASSFIKKIAKSLTAKYCGCWLWLRDRRDGYRREKDASTFVFTNIIYV